MNGRYIRNIQEKTMLSVKQLQGLHSNQRLLIEELQQRGISVRMMVKEMEFVEADYKGHRELILDRDSSINPYPSVVLSGDKYLTKQLLKRARLSVPKGERFYVDELDEALHYAQSIGYPLVVKPTFGSHGEQVHMHLETLCQVKTAIDELLAATRNKSSFLIEEQFDGKEYRVFITEDGEYAVLHRDPASVIGDGKKSIEQIAAAVSYKRMHPRKNSLCPIAIDDTVLKYLARSGLDLKHVPRKDEKVYLRPNSNVAVGGLCEDYTDKVHPSVIEICKHALAVFPNMPYAGIDFMSHDITTKQKQADYRILEVNSNPGIHMHMRPGIGLPRNVARNIVDLMYPETKTPIH
jgi:cyanophycin synthetase